MWRTLGSISKSLWIVIVVSLNLPVSAIALDISQVKGCMVRSNGLSFETVPDIVPNIKVMEGHVLRDHNVNELILDEKKEPLTKKGEGFVVYCRCKTKSSSPVTIVAGVEYMLKDGKYTPGFAFAQSDAIADLSQSSTRSTLTMAHDADYTGDRALLYRKGSILPEGGTLRGKGSLVITRSQPQADNPIGNQTKENHEATFFISWSRHGVAPSKMATKAWGEIPCL